MAQLSNLYPDKSAVRISTCTSMSIHKNNKLRKIEKWELVDVPELSLGTEFIWHSSKRTDPGWPQLTRWSLREYNSHYTHYQILWFHYNESLYLPSLTQKKFWGHSQIKKEYSLKPEVRSEQQIKQLQYNHSNNHCQQIADPVWLSIIRRDAVF